MISKEITICINPGVECKSIHVDWIGTEGLINPCKDKNCITVAVDPNNPTQCLEGFIVCLDENGNQACKNCEPIHFRKCFCTLDSDCGDCGNCGPDGMCKDICSPTETAQGKVCYPDGCKCPPNKPFLDPKTGKCAQCISGSVDPKNPCRICVDGEWVTKDCGTNAVCDQTTGDCITDCSKNTNGRTVWNPVTKQCECEIGYRWSTVKNTCVVDEPCSEGYRRNPITDDCEKIDCPPGQVYNPVTDKCDEKPCDPTNCETGLDCTGKNCGCGPDKKCVSCKDNPNALGCKDKEDECKREYCDDENPCKGPNCTCVENKCVGCSNFPCDKCGQQVGCKCTDGSNCSGTDDEDDCKDELKVEMKDCSLMTQLKLQKPCNCSGIGSSVKVKNRNNTKLYSPNTLGTVGFQSALLEHYIDFEIDLRDKFSNNTTGYELLNRFLESSTDINNNFPDTASCSVEITSFFKDKDGVVFSTPTQTLTSEIKSGTIGARTTVVSFENILLGRTIPISFTESGRPEPTPVSTFIGYQLTVYIGDIVFQDKGCTYDRTRVYKTNSNSYETFEASTTYRYVTLASLSSANKRNPLLTIKRDNEVIRKLYITPTSPGVYDDFLHGPKKLSLLERGIQSLVSPQGELISLKDYHFEWDCGCDRTKTIKSLVKCDLKEFRHEKHFKINTSINSDVCNNQIVLLEEHLPCPINQDLEYFGWGGNHPSQTKYIVEITDIDGGVTKVGTFLYKNTTDTTGYFRKEGTNEQFTNFTFTHTKQIVSASIRMNHDASCVKQDSANLFIKEADIVLTCIGNSVKADITSGGTLITKVEIPTLNIESVTNNNGTSLVTLNNLPQNTDITFVITYLGNCKRSQTLKKNCCDSDGLILNSIGTVNKLLSVKTQNNAIITDILINGITRFNDFTLNGSTYTIPTTNLGNTISVDVITQTLNGCAFFVDNYNLGTNYEINFQLVPNIICTGGTSAIQITDGPPNTTVIVRDPNNSQILISLNNDGDGTSTPITTAGNYDIIQIGTETIAPGSLPTRVLTVQTSIVVDSVIIETPAPSGICANNDYNFIVTGTFGANVDILATAPGYNNPKVATLTTPLAGSPGKGYGVVSYNFNSPGTYTIASGLATLTGCQSATNTSTTVTVNTAPFISSVTSDCIAPVTTTSDININVTLASYTGVVTVSVKDLTTNVVVTLTNPTLSTVFTGMMPQGSGRSFEITAQSGTCSDTYNFTAPSCSCTYIPPAPVFPNYFICSFPGEAMSPTNSNPFNSNTNVIDLYFGTVLVKTLTSSDASYQVLSAGQFGTYTAITRHLATGCTSLPTTFTVETGDIDVNISVSTLVDFCTSTPFPLTAVVTGTTNFSNLIYKWFINGIEVSGVTGSVLNVVPNNTYIPTTTFSVEVRRNSTSGSVYSSSCVATDTKTVNFVDCCPTLTLTYNGALSTQCDGMTINVSAPVGTNPTSALYYEVYQPASSTTPLVTGTTYLNFGSFNIDKNDLIPGNNQYRIVVGFVSSITCKTEIIVTHNSGLICEAVNYVFIVDNSGSISTTEFNQIANQVISFSNSLYTNNNQSRFALAHYSSTNTLPLTHALNIQSVGQNSPISVVTRTAIGGLDYLQDSLALFNINNFTGLDTSKPTKIIIFTDATGISGSQISDTFLSTTAIDNTLPGIGANFVSTMPYSASDALKVNYEIFVIRYPHNETYPSIQLGPYASMQALSDAMLTQVASPGRFFAADYTSNTAITQALQTLGCNC